MENLGYSYGWISDTEAFNILVGLNMDGSERIDYVPDENWVPSEKSEEDKEFCGQTNVIIRDRLLRYIWIPLLILTGK